MGTQAASQTESLNSALGSIAVEDLDIPLAGSDKSGESDVMDRIAASLEPDTKAPVEIEDVEESLEVVEPKDEEKEDVDRDTADKDDDTATDDI